jgi:hypothetical protein
MYPIAPDPGDDFCIPYRRHLTSWGLNEDKNLAIHESAGRAPASRTARLSAFSRCCGDAIYSSLSG